MEVNDEIETRLPTEGAEHAVGLFPFDTPLEHRHREGLDVDPVGHVLVGHDRGRVRVDQHDLDALFTKGTACLGPGIVKLGGLPDYDRTRTNYQYFFRH